MHLDVLLPCTVLQILRKKMALRGLLHLEFYVLVLSQGAVLVPYEVQY